MINAVNAVTNDGTTLYTAGNTYSVSRMVLSRLVWNSKTTAVPNLEEKSRGRHAYFTEAVIEEGKIKTRTNDCKLQSHFTSNWLVEDCL